MDILDTAPFHDCFETVLHGTRLNIVGFISSQYISLLYSLLNQFFTQRTCYRDISDGALALRLCNQNRSFPFTIRCLYALHRPVNMDHIVFKRNIIPGQRTQFCFCQYKSKKNLLLIRKKHHCFHPVMLHANNLIPFMLFLLCRKCHPSSSLSPYDLVHK